jgi:hypothetical protein
MVSLRATFQVLLNPIPSRTFQEPRKGEGEAEEGLTRNPNELTQGRVVPAARADWA